MKFRKKRRFLLFLAFSAFFLSVYAVFRGAGEILKSVAEASMRSFTMESVNDAVFFTLKDEVRYLDLVEVERNEVGEILSVRSNSLKINAIARDVASLSQQILKEKSERGLSIPLGAFTGIDLFTGAGPKINVKIIPIANVACKFLSSFEAVGINQTKHSIYLEIVADVSMVTMNQTTAFTSRTQVLLSESVLVGRVPNVFLSQGGGTKIPLV